MEVSELNLEKNSYNFSCNSFKAGSHYKTSMRLGRCLPTTLVQAKYFIDENICLNVLNFHDVTMVEAILNKHGFIGDYVYTKSKNWVRLQNNDDLRKALKMEFNYKQ